MKFRFAFILFFFLPSAFSQILTTFPPSGSSHLNTTVKFVMRMVPRFDTYLCVLEDDDTTPPSCLVSSRVSLTAEHFCKSGSVTLNTANFTIHQPKTIVNVVLCNAMGKAMSPPQRFVYSSASAVTNPEFSPSSGLILAGANVTVFSANASYFCFMVKSNDSTEEATNITPTCGVYKCVFGNFSSSNIFSLAITRAVSISVVSCLFESKSSILSSDVVSASYAPTLPALPPIFSPPGGQIGKNAVISLSSALASYFCITVVLHGTPQCNYDGNGCDFGEELSLAAALTRMTKSSYIKAQSCKQRANSEIVSTLFDVVDGPASNVTCSIPSNTAVEVGTVVFFGSAIASFLCVGLNRMMTSRDSFCVENGCVQNSTLTTSQSQISIYKGTAFAVQACLVGGTNSPIVNLQYSIVISNIVALTAPLLYPVGFISMSSSDNNGTTSAEYSQVNVSISSSLSAYICYTMTLVTAPPSSITLNGTMKNFRIGNPSNDSSHSDEQQRLCGIDGCAANLDGIKRAPIGSSMLNFTNAPVGSQWIVNAQGCKGAAYSPVSSSIFEVSDPFESRITFTPDTRLVEVWSILTIASYGVTYMCLTDDGVTVPVCDLSSSTCLFSKYFTTSFVYLITSNVSLIVIGCLAGSFNSNYASTQAKRNFFFPSSNAVVFRSVNFTLNPATSSATRPEVNVPSGIVPFGIYVQLNSSSASHLCFTEETQSVAPLCSDNGCSYGKLQIGQFLRVQIVSDVCLQVQGCRSTGNSDIMKAFYYIAPNRSRQAVHCNHVLIVFVLAFFLFYIFLLDDVFHSI